MINKQESILCRTHQAWKYNVSLAVDWLGIIIAVGVFYYYNAHHQWQLLCLMIAGMLFVTGFFINSRIKCPKCGSLWYWHALKTPFKENGLGKLRSQKACPICRMGIDEVDSKGHLIGKRIDRRSRDHP